MNYHKIKSFKKMGTPLAVGITAGVVCICACVAICLCLKYRRDNPGSGNNNSNTEVILASGGKENNIGDIGNTAIKMRDKNVDWADETEMNNDLDTKEFIPETRLPANASLADKEQFKRIVEPKIAEWRETLEKTMKGGNDDTQDIWNLKEQVG